MSGKPRLSHGIPQTAIPTNDLLRTPNETPCPCVSARNHAPTSPPTELIPNETIHMFRFPLEPQSTIRIMYTHTVSCRTI